MMLRRFCTALCATFAFASVLQAADLLENVFVKTPENGGNDANSGESWELAKATIGEALNAVAANGTVTVGPGTYVVTATGTAVGTDPALTVANGVKLVSSEGPEKTVIMQDRTTGVSKSTILNIGGAGTVVSGFAISDFVSYGVNFIAPAGAMLTNCIVRNLYPKTSNLEGAGIYMKTAIGKIVGCVISNNEVYVSGGSSRNGIGVYMQGATAFMSDCVIADNRISGSSGSTSGAGAGLFMNGNCTVRNCLIVGNSDVTLGGAAVKMQQGTLESCTIAGNKTTGASSSGGLWLAGTGTKTLRNNIIYGNISSGSFTNWRNDGTGTLTATYNNAAPAFSKTDGNVSVDPAFAADWTLGAGKCVDGGVNQTWMVGAKDLGGNDRIVNERVDMGCYEKVAGKLEASFDYTPLTGLLAPVDVTFTAQVSGSDLSGLVYKWEFNNPAVEDAEGAEYAQLTRTFPAGTYTNKLTVTNGKGETASFEGSLQVGPKIAYVSKTGAHEFPYDTEAKAATNVAFALAAAVDGTCVEILEGTYALSESVVVRKDVRIHGAGPEATVLDAARQAFTVLELANAGAFVDGLTLTGSKLHGLVISAPGVVSNCVICGNSSTTQQTGTGVYMGSAGTLTHCTVTDNHITVGGNSSSGCGIYCNGANYVIDTCVVTGNSGTQGVGQGAVHLESSGTVRNTLVCGNTQTPDATSKVPASAGIYLISQNNRSVIENCTVVGNTLNFEKDGAAGLYVGNNGLIDIRNTIVWDNRAAGGVSDCFFASGISGGTAQCSILNNLPAKVTAENVTYEDPLLNSKHRPRMGSPCIDTGTNQEWMVGAKDVYGRDRIIGPRVDIGAAEFSPSGLMLLFK